MLAFVCFIGTAAAFGTPAAAASDALQVTTLAGLSPIGAANGSGSAARFFDPSAVAYDADGNIYVADTYNNTIRKVTSAGTVTTLAGSPGLYGSADGIGSAARFSAPSGVACDRAGNVYVADMGNDTLRKITPAGVVTTLAGSAGLGGFADGTGNAARFYLPQGVACDAAGNVYVADTGSYTIRKVSTSGEVTTLAGGAWSQGIADGTGSAARFHDPTGIACDAAGNVYVADTGNGTIRKITPIGEVTTLAGPAGVAVFECPRGVACDAAGNVYVADSNNSTISKISPAGEVTTVAGLSYRLGGDWMYGSADGSGSAARFFWPWGIACDADGKVCVADTGNSTIRTVTAGVVTTIAGLAVRPDSTDGTGSAARFDQPAGVACDAAGNVYVADSYNGTIRKVTSAGVVTTLAGLAHSSGSAGGSGSEARFFWPQGVACDANGNVYVADTSNSTIRKITRQGEVTTLAGLATSEGLVNGTGSAARFRNPWGVACDAAGNVYVADTNNCTIRQVTPDGIVTTLAGGSAVSSSADGTGSAAGFLFPQGVACDAAGNVYVADTRNCIIRKVSPGGVVTTLAGLAGSSGSTDGTGGAARFDGPAGVTCDAAGDVYVADSGNSTIRRITPAGVVTTVASSAWSRGWADGTGSAARFNYPSGVACDAAGNVYVADMGNNTIRKGVLLSVGNTSAGSDQTVELPGDITVEIGEVTTSGNTTVVTSRTNSDPITGAEPVSDYTTIDTTAGTSGEMTVTLPYDTNQVSPAEAEHLVVLEQQPDGSWTSLPTTVNANGTVSATTSELGTFVVVLDTKMPLVTVSTLPDLPASGWYTSGVTVTLAASDAGSGITAFAYQIDPADPIDQNAWTVVVGPTVSFPLDDTQSHTVVYRATDGAHNTLQGSYAVGIAPHEMLQVTTLAGLALARGSTDGTGSAARFGSPNSIACDAAGNLYVADSFNHTIRKVTPDGVVTTLAGLAGSAGSTDGSGSEARFYLPKGIACDAAGNLYVADSFNHTIRKVTPDGVVTTLAGLAGAWGSTDGSGSDARFYYPEGIACDAADNIYVADTYNNTIRKVTPDGVVTTFAGGWAVFSYPQGLACDAAGNIYVADVNHHTIRKVTPTGVVTTLAGLALARGSIDGSGSAARFNNPWGVACDPAGNVYVAEPDNHTIRMVTPDGVVTTVAGLVGSAGSTDGSGSAARFGYAYGIACDAKGNVYIADSSNDTIRRGVPVGGNTPVGTDQTVDLGGGTSVSFPEVTAPGETAVTTSPTNPGDPITGADPVGDYTTVGTTAGVSGPITVTLPYDPSQVPVGEAEHLVVLQLQDDGSWSALPTTVNSDGTVSATTDHLGTFVVVLDTGLVAISGVTWHDLDADGVRDTGAGGTYTEPGLQNWQVRAEGSSLQVTSPEPVADLHPDVLVGSPDGAASGQLMFCGLGGPVTYPADLRGNIALIQRGTYTFEEKVANVAAAGAVGVIIYNNVPGSFSGTLQGTGAIPAVGISAAEGATLQSLLAAGPVSVSLLVASRSAVTDVTGTYSLALKPGMKWTITEVGELQPDGSYAWGDWRISSPLGGAYTVTPVSGAANQTFDPAAQAPDFGNYKDAQPPHTTATTTPSTPANGWFKEPVTVQLTASDAGSQVDWIEYQILRPPNPGEPPSPVAPAKIRVPGAMATVSFPDEDRYVLLFQAHDAAGNTEETQELAIDVDWTAPTIDLALPVEGAAYQQGIGYDVDWSVRDNVVGATQVLTSASQPSGQKLDTSKAGSFTFTVTATDPAGNVATKTVQYTVGNTLPGPDQTVTPNPDAGVTLTFDNVTSPGTTTLTVTQTNPVPGQIPSGYKVNGSYYLIETTAAFTGHIIIAIHYDDAGLTQKQEEKLTLRHWDGSGWHDCTVPPVDTVKNIIYGEVTSLSPFVVLEDITPPTVSFSTPADGSTFVQGQVVKPSVAAQDAGTGIDDAATVFSPALVGGALDTSSVGGKTVTVTVFDRAGNQASATLHYSVNYVWSGFFQPVDNPGTGSAPVFNVAKAGSAIPVKFSLGGNMGLQIFAAGYPKVVKTTEGTIYSEDAIEQTVTAATSGLNYDPIANQYIYVWKTDKALAGTCQTLQLKLIDGTMHYANFTFKK